MSTNYYAIYDECDCTCDHCSKKGMAYHLGKSSTGWAFALHIEPSMNLYDLEDIITFLIQKKATIIDERNSYCSLEDWLGLVVDLHPEVKHREDGKRCLVGSGTFDLLEGEFC